MIIFMREKFTYVKFVISGCFWTWRECLRQVFYKDISHKVWRTVV